NRTSHAYSSAPPSFLVNERYVYTSSSPERRTRESLGGGHASDERTQHGPQDTRGLLKAGRLLSRCLVHVQPAIDLDHQRRHAPVAPIPRARDQRTGVRPIDGQLETTRCKAFVTAVASSRGVWKGSAPLAAIGPS